MNRRICFFSGDITRSGGTERVSSIIANELIKDEKFDVCFLSLFEKKKETFFYLNQEINRYRLFDHEVSGLKHFFGYIQRIHKFVVKEKIDILIDIDGILDIYSVPALVGTKTKLISWEQFTYHQNPDVNYRKYTRKLAARKADAIVVLTNKDKENFQNNLKIRRIIKHIYNPIIINDNQNNYDVNSKVIITVGRLVKDKGLEYLVEVAKNVFKKHSDWTWKIAGEGEEKDFLEEKIQEYHLEDKLILCGNVNDIDALYEKSAIYVMTSKFEGFGLVLTEAKSFHLPCVSFNCDAGPSEIILDGVNGYLVDCFETKQMTDKICELIENKETRVEFSNKALEDTEKFLIESVISEWKKLLMEI